MESTRKRTDFGEMLRTMRLNKSLTQREVGEKSDISPSTVGNAESAPYRVMGKDAVHRIANLFELNDSDRTRFLDAWSRTPLSEYSQRQRKTWEKRNALRSKAKNHDKLKLNLIEVMGCRLMDIPDELLCECSFGEPLCITCAALDALGLPPYTPSDREKLFDQLHREKSKLVPAPPERP